MWRRHHCSIVLVCFLVSLSACSKDEGRNPNSNSDGGSTSPEQKSKWDSPDPSKNLVWVTHVLDNQSAGLHASIGGSGDALGIAYYRKLPDKVVLKCVPNFGGGQAAVVDAWDLYYIHFDGNNWSTTPVRIDQTIGVHYGISMAFDSTGKIYIGYLGGAISQQECNASDAMMATSNDGTSFSTQTINTTGGTGDTVGYWMSVAVDKDNAVHSTYKDVRFGYYEASNKYLASLFYDTERISPTNGAGDFSSLAFDTQNQPVVAFYNSAANLAGDRGIKLMIKKGNSWETKGLSNENTTERLGLATDGAGLFGLVYFSVPKQTAIYMESPKDFANWTSKEVDLSTTRKGEFPSLAFDKAGNPAISYYRCSEYGASNCQAQKDGLVFAYRLEGKWKTYEVDTGKDQYCGRYTSLTFDKDNLPVIAYQCVEYNNLLDGGKGGYVDTLKVAHGVFQ